MVATPPGLLEFSDELALIENKTELIEPLAIDAPDKTLNATYLPSAPELSLRPKYKGFPTVSPERVQVPEEVLVPLR
jgi:hypothetical protein